METTIYKGSSGWAAESNTEADANGKMWQIRTYGNRGKITCTATEATDKGNGMISMDLFGAKRIELATRDGKATEKAITEVHAEGLKAFEQLEFKPAYVIEVGQIIFDHDQDYKRAVYEIVRPGEYRTVTLDGQNLLRDDHVKPYSAKFGIGSYYNEGDKIGALEVQELVKQATEVKRLKEEAETKQAEEAAKERAEKIEAGRKLISELPSGAAAIVVAEFRVDDSDPQSDYHGSHTEEHIFLSWSKHTRDLFPELRKAAAKFEGTKEYETGPDSLEHREKWSMGAGYYLGDSKWSGWIVRKRNLSNTREMLETLQIAAAEGRFLCGDFDSSEPDFEPVKTEVGTVQIIDYSERAIAVVGDTKPIKETLKALGGKFNFRLSCGPGWIFSKTRLNAVQKALGAQVQAEDQAGAMVQAQEEAVYDNFCHANNI